MNILKKPIKSFKGDGKFVYACYSLEDSEVVFPILVKLDQNRYRIRYDECNQEEVKVDALRKHNIKNCEVFLAFLSQKALQSPYVVNQLEMAQSFDSASSVSVSVICALSPYTSCSIAATVPAETVLLLPVTL